MKLFSSNLCKLMIINGLQGFYQPVLSIISDFPLSPVIGILETLLTRKKPFQSLERLFLLVEIVGVEPTTPCLQSRCSSQLSYTPECGCKDATLFRILQIFLHHLHPFPIYFFLCRKPVNCLVFQLFLDLQESVVFSNPLRSAE